VEGVLDEAVLQRLLDIVEMDLYPVHGKKGKPWLRERIAGFNAAAIHNPWVVLVDLDHDSRCPSSLVNEWLPTPARYMRLRVAVRSIEAWLLADRDRIGEFLSIARSKVPQNPEQLESPKQTLINLARASRRSDIRQDLVPRPTSGRIEGPAYTSRLVEFVSDPENGWRPHTARDHAESLKRCLLCLERLGTTRRQVEGR
jgi:hypothetical protein